MKNPPAVVYRDRFGTAWSPLTAPTVTRPTVPVRGGTDGPTPFETALYLVARARDCLVEPLIYGPFRMIAGVSRTLEGQASDGCLTEMKAAIDREKYSVMADRASCARWLDDLQRHCAA